MCMTTAIRATRNFCRPFLPPTARTIPLLSPDEHYLFVQNSLLNLEGMSDGSVTVIDLRKGARW